MDMSRLESGALRFQWEECDLVDILEDVVRRFGVEACEHPLDLIREAGTALCTIDRRFMERVIWNLLDNAAKYSPRQAPIRVQVGSISDTVYFSVIDFGTGIALSEREHIFERFYRGTTTETTAGCGLGLAICRAVVDVHGGTISVQSSLGSGSTFTVELPSGSRSTR
jgi:signal transduction histidine kinase